MEIRSSEEARESVIRFAKEYVKILTAKKNLDVEIKEMKNAHKENGVPVAVVCKAINRIKADKKKTDTERFEEDTIQDWIRACIEVDESIDILTAK